jgi:hypothetical protein
MQRGADGLLQLALIVCQIDAAQDGVLWRQVGRDLGLGAAEQEGLDAANELNAAHGIVVLLDRRAEPLREAFAVTEQAGVEEGKLGSQLLQIVFDRCARQAETMARIKLAYRACRLRIRALDDLRFIQHDEVPRQPLHLFDTAGQNGVGRDDDMNTVEFGATLMTVEAVQDGDAQMR